jgi:predicted pyridoxine 5'-phosphate oxidase superfamily flavin-nucleotide-binding protein
MEGHDGGMKRALQLLAVLTVVSPLWAAAEDSAPASQAKTLQLRPKSLLIPAPQATQPAPFLAPVGEPTLDFQPHNTDERLKEIRASCENGGRSLCYDTDSGKIVYKKTAEYMPAIPGMRAEHISVKRDRVTFKYSFR